MAIEQPSDDQLKSIEAGKPVPLSGSKDGQGAGDNDQPYTFGRKPNTQAPFPFAPRQYVRLLVLRGKVWQEAEESNRQPNLKRFNLKANEGKTKS